MTPFKRFARCACAPLFFCAAAASSAQQIAFTWDDLPAHSSLPAGVTRVEVADKILTAMKSAGLPPAYGFVNGIRIEQEPASAAVLDRWRAAGYPLGNHTWSHMNLNEHTALEWEADLGKNEPLLRQKAGSTDWHWLRFPYLAEGNTPEKSREVRSYLAQHGYRIAAVTMSFGDYAWNEPYARCAAKANAGAIDSLEQSYLAAAGATADSTRALSKAAYGQDIPYVLLMHVGAFDARMLPRLIELYRRRGFTFITLEEAQKDRFYRDDEHPELPGPMLSLERAAAEKQTGKPATAPALPDFAALCR